MGALTGFLAIGTTAARTQIRWLTLFIAATGLGLLGPIVSLAIFRDSPDVFVPVALSYLPGGHSPSVWTGGLAFGMQRIAQPLSVPVHRLGEETRRARW